MEAMRGQRAGHTGQAQTRGKQQGEWDSEPTVCPRQQAPHMLPAGVGPNPGRCQPRPCRCMQGSGCTWLPWECRWELQVGTWFLATALPWIRCHSLTPWTMNSSSFFGIQEALFPVHVSFWALSCDFSFTIIPGLVLTLSSVSKINTTSVLQSW